MRSITGVLTVCERVGPYLIAAEDLDKDDFIPINRHDAFPVTIPFRFWSEARAIEYAERVAEQYGLATQVWEQLAPTHFRVAWGAKWKIRDISF